MTPRAAPRPVAEPGATGPGDVPVHLVRGDDPALVAQAAHRLIDELVGDRDPALVVEEHGGPSANELDVGLVIDACTTPPFLVDRRVVVLRDAGRLGAADAARLVAYLADPLSSTRLVLVGGGGAVPQTLTKAVARAGSVLDSSAGRGVRERRHWLDEQLAAGPVRLSGPAATHLATHLGDDLGRLEGILQTLAAAYGEGATVDDGQLAPYLGGAGAVAPFELTDAIDKGRAGDALTVLHRLVGAAGMAAPQVLGVLHGHYARLLRLDGAAVTSKEEAAALLGGHPFVAQKALAQSRSLGSVKVSQAVALLADADLDVKGRSGLDSTLVLEVLVARLSRLTRGRAPARRGSAP